MMKLTPMKKIAIKQQCRQWRIANRYTMQAIAEVAGVSRQAIREFEIGSGCTMKIIAAYVKIGMPVTEIMQAVGMTPEDIFTEG